MRFESVNKPAGRLKWSKQTALGFERKKAKKKTKSNAFSVGLRFWFAGVWKRTDEARANKAAVSCADKSSGVIFSDREERKPAENPCRSPRFCSQQQKGSSGVETTSPKTLILFDSSHRQSSTSSAMRRPTLFFFFFLLFFGFRFPTESSVLCDGL